MKRKLISVLMIAILMISLAGCQKEKGAGDESLKYITDKGTLVLGLDDTFAPMGFRDDNGNIVGFDIDLATAVCEKLGVELVLQPVEWEAKEQELSTKSIDCIWNGLSITPEREENLALSMAYMTNTITLVVEKDSPVATMADMAGKRLALQSGSSAEETLNAEENKEFKDSLGQVNPFGDYAVALMDLETGNSDAVLMDSVVADYMIISAGKDYKILDENLLEDRYAVGFRKGDEALCKAVNDALKELKADGTVAEISTKWFGTDITTIQ
ncbi:MAG TPA: amino acid ABC transporter substrate-binding protein [Clostridiales bacterium]|nr:amino acid ABC transporter substrate-binding protein [Clostridiales bacterium]